MVSKHKSETVKQHSNERVFQDLSVLPLYFSFVSLFACVVIAATAAVVGLTALALYLTKKRSSPLVLYIYEHCPYCTKAQMIFGLKKVPFQVEVLLNDDEKTPISYVNAKQVPILKKEDGTYMPESMDIVHFVDQNYGAPIVRKLDTPDLDAWLKSTDELTRKLCMARYVNPAFAFKEFSTASAIQYFTKKKRQPLEPLSNPC